MAAEIESSSVRNWRNSQSGQDGQIPHRITDSRLAMRRSNDHRQRRRGWRQHSFRPSRNPEADLGDADIATGELDSSKIQAEKRDWVWFTYNSSPVLNHQLPSPFNFDLSSFDLSQSLPQEFARPIAVVGPSGIDACLKIEIRDVVPAPIN